MNGIIGINDGITSTADIKAHVKRIFLIQEPILRFIKVITRKTKIDDARFGKLSHIPQSRM